MRKFRKIKKGVLKTEISVKCLDQETKTTLVCQYQLKLENKQNGVIVLASQLFRAMVTGFLFFIFNQKEINTKNTDKYFSK